ncbi:ABC transporter permease [Marinomonas sp. SBI22]|uniref:ABC transporter permease n=1 Tax=unclassified Marinomonas TaxID=196814 RepID=UPI0007AF4AC4|nr:MULTISPECIES: ABC transporter permease [unclassified Marinomonas]KZM44991.1 ABC transporter permease [Marinomonas sp. SBI22]KZM46690.1 ABC transporter permease [Marinomonas sp. SBI8L]
MNKFINTSFGRVLVISFLLVLFWWLVVAVTQVPSFILPPPEKVFTRFWQLTDVLYPHFLVTLIEIVFGVLLGVSAGLIFAILMVYFKPVRIWLLPVLLFSQAIPVFAIAPILVLWFGYGIVSKVIMAAVIIFFPILMTSFDGLRQSSKDYLELAQSMQANRLSILFRIQLPAALPVMASGLRMAMVVAPIGAIIGEWVGSSQGLGYFMLYANARMQVADMFAALFVLCLLSISLYYLADQCLKKLIFWQQDNS